MRTEAELLEALEETLRAKRAAVKEGDSATALVAVASADVLRWALGLPSLFESLMDRNAAARRAHANN